MTVPLTLACGRYDRVQALTDGRVQPEGVDLTVVHLEPEECFWRMLRHAEFDAAEMSLASYAIAVANGDDRFVGVPAFLSRSFRHSSMYVRDDGSVTEPADLAGRAIGVPEYQMTASVWTRGLLRHQLGVDLDGVTWRTGGLEQPGRTERQRLSLPDHVTVEPLPSDTTLTAALLDGTIDMIMAPRVPSAFRRPGSGLRRLLPDYAERELAYYAETGLFPIMHLVVVRRDVAERLPWLPRSLEKALTQAKRLATDGVADLPALRYTMPFLLDALERQQAVFGDDPWPYGVEANRPALETFLGYLAEQGLFGTAGTPPTVEALFAPSTLDASRI
ncbi:ABC transporter substrate-binding protein [Nocardioides marinquilinus]|uniref:ABC transporter substrate-binding protein n=1 Tax=Nocardioides marinquilinus TaxID=1210400 RepID=A0ABP9PB51_9ACTN